ncbi:hypothetical protein, partial [Mycobacteroides franklinii]|uniref:hypothetical protein n=1 Tax=Mycobacteroides franklinii TaxID=948102 RepID=UPI001A97D5BE
LFDKIGDPVLDVERATAVVENYRGRENATFVQVCAMRCPACRYLTPIRHIMSVNLAVFI